MQSFVFCRLLLKVILKLLYRLLHLLLLQLCIYYILLYIIYYLLLQCYLYMKIDKSLKDNKDLLLSTLSCKMLKNGQTYFKNLAVKAPQDF